MSAVYEVALKVSALLGSSYVKNLSRAQKSLEGIEKQKRALDKVMSQRRATLEAAQAYAQSQERLAALQRQYRNAKAPTQALKAEIQTAGRAVSAANQAYLKQKEILKQLNAAAGTAGKGIRELNERYASLSRQQRFYNAQQKVNDLAGSADAFRSARLGKAMGGFGKAAAVGGMAAIAAVPIKVGADFEATMSRVGAVSGATQEELAKLTAQARELGATTVWSASEAAEGMTYLSMAGFNTEQMMQAMPGMLDLASAGAIDLASAADIASNILSGFGLKASEIGRVGDVLTNTFTKSNTSMSSLGETMKYVAPIAATTGVSLETVSAMAGKLGDAGIQGSEAGTALRAIISRLVAPSAAGMKALNALGVSTTDAAGRLRDMPEVLAELNAKMSRLPDSVRSAMTKSIFETEAMSAAFVLMEQAGSGALGEMVENVGKAGSAARVAAKQNDNLIGDYKNLESAIEEMAHIFYDSVAPTLRYLTQGITSAAEAFGGFARENQTVIKWAAILLGGLGGLVAAVAGLGAGLNLLLYILGTGAAGFLKFASIIMTVVKAFGVLSAALLANPIALIVIGIAALIAAGVTLYRNWDLVKAKAAALWQSFQENFPTAFAVVTSVFDGIAAKIEAAKAVFNGIIEFVKNVFAGNWEQAWAGLADVVKGIFDLLPGFITKPIEFISEKVSGLISKIKGWFGGDNSATFKVESLANNPAVQATLSQPMQVPKLAAGGITSGPTLAMIGEGTEQEAVMPLSKLGAMLNSGQSSPGTVSSPVSITFSPVINISGSSGSDPYGQVKAALSAGSRDLKRELEQLLWDRERLSYA